MKKDDKFICTYWRKSNYCLKGKTCGIFCDKYGRCIQCKHEIYENPVCNNCKWKDNNPHV